MRKIFLVLFFFFIHTVGVFSYEKPEIISRDQWGANEEYIYKDTAFWKKKFAAWAEARKKAAAQPKTEPTAYQIKRRAWKKQAEQIWIKNFPSDLQTIEKVASINARPLMWTIKKTENIGGIIIHHTETSADTPLATIQSIQKFHSLSRAWGDIGYNYLIGTDGKIYEGRKGGERSVGAHTKWNNSGNIGISLMGSYNDKPISQLQYDTLKKLVGYLVEKYNIDLTKKRPFFRECNNMKKCATPLQVNYLVPIITHRDAGNTTCPGDELYAQVQKIRQELFDEQQGNVYDYGKYDRAFEKIDDTKLLSALQKAEKLLDKKYHRKIQEIKLLLIDYFERKYKNKYVNTGKTDVSIKVKLSYPSEENTLKIFDGKQMHSFELKDKKLYQDDVEIETATIVAKDIPILTIVSWDRVPKWDKLQRYNDNKFRGKLIVSQQDGEFLIVNELPLESYLKGLGEVSNSEHSEKAKAIIVSARTYALWYIQKARKFPGATYDASDDPDVFQRYLGYGLEQRSPKLNKFVDETIGQVLTYNNELIKPWYFNSSNGKTKSYYEYCIGNKNTKSQCEEGQKLYPFLDSVIDPGSIGYNFNGHGVGLSGNGASYFAKRGWTYDMILRYFYSGVEVE